MAQRIRWTPFALEDLICLHDYIAADSRRHAKAVIRKIRAQVRSLREFPLVGRVVPEFAGRSLRQIPAYHHRIIYRVRGDTIEIIGVIHGARDLTALWEKEGRPVDEDVPDDASS